MSEEQPLELECWRDPTNERVLVKLRRWKYNGHNQPMTKEGIIIYVPEGSLWQVTEGCRYPEYQLPSTKPLASSIAAEAPIYMQGSSKPIAWSQGMATESKPSLSKFSKGYSCPTGVDTKITINDERIGCVQGFSVSPKGGSMIFLVFDSMEHTKWLNEKVRFKAEYVDENGKIITLYDADIHFHEHEHYGLSIDDIVMEVQLEFDLIKRHIEEDGDEDQESDK
jgi:hypothetical protein